MAAIWKRGNYWQVEIRHLGQPKQNRTFDTKANAEANPRATPGSVETSHGIIHAAVKSKQFLFVSAIANRLGYFNMEVAPRNYAQDFAVAHNAAVALAWLLPELLMALSR